ncbi:polysaccharide pyruvyl transferase family protein [Zavarzinia aquatilis]|uniref:Polysaccharide pyruvyl transferase domain-containing protein n=1 Tax=Zavarzinia aquatilis TaxID=2211142 RepID=A0A317E3T9_9PROT|nr:polysaccharide pyruvyl transferase family protein [Zavarzinia aquatilis]PWR21252.1 hypothetical protein DKG74_14755 [Zavarzinia aquatilis]
MKHDKSVVLLGFFARGNAGDEAFLHVQYELLKDKYNIIVPIEHKNAHPDFRSWYPYTECEVINYDEIPRLYAPDVVGLHIGGGSLAFGFSGQFLLTALDAGKKTLVSGIDAALKPRLPADHIRFDIYNRLDFFSVRTIKSLDNLRKNDVAVHHGADWALGLGVIEPPAAKRGGALVTIRAFGEPPGDEHRRDMLALHRYLERQGHRVRYLPFAPEDRGFLDLMPHVTPDMIENVWWDPRQVKGLIAAADVVVSVGRLHTLILSMTARTPTFAIDPKIMSDGRHILNRKNLNFTQEVGLDFFHSVDDLIGAYGDDFSSKIAVRDFSPDYYERLESQKGFIRAILEADVDSLPARGEAGHWSGSTPGGRPLEDTLSSLKTEEEAREEKRRLKREEKRREKFEAREKV